jgi:hypothetical protein
MFVPVRATPGGQSVFSADGVITDTSSWCPLLAACCLQVNQALELYPQHADSLELKKQLRMQLNAV